MLRAMGCMRYPIGFREMDAVTFVRRVEHRVRGRARSCVQALVVVRLRCDVKGAWRYSRPFGSGGFKDLAQELRAPGLRDVSR